MLTGRLKGWTTANEAPSPPIEVQRPEEPTSPAEDLADPPAPGGRPRRKRGLAVMDSERTCADDGCEKLIEDDDDMLKCDSP